MGIEISDRIKRLHEILDRLRQESTKIRFDEGTHSIIAQALDCSSSDKQVDYFEHLLAELTLEADAHEVLLYMNFNSRKYFHYYIQVVTSRFESEDTSLGKLEKLRYEQKIVNQVPCEFGVAYTDKYPPLQQMIGDWISEEIQFLERTSETPIVHSLQEKGVVKKDFKLEFDMSVSQFAFFIKSFIETGVIQNKNVSELIRFLARFVKTKRSENISYESFRIKYYNVEDSTKDAVKNTFHTAIGFINRN
jgi:hypothetical protein